jgi:ABC-type lipoprotein release transport system permease subunit
VLAFAGVSLLLAGVALYGVLSYLVAQRSVEIAIRIALGAQRPEVLRVVLVDGLMPVFFGAAAGLAGAAVAESLIRSCRPLGAADAVTPMQGEPCLRLQANANTLRPLPKWIRPSGRAPAN